MGAACSSDASNNTVDGPIKYYYFGMEPATNLKARGLGIHATLEVGNVNYEGVVVTVGDWFGGKIDKEAMSPMAYLAVIELPDGTKVCESVACLQMAGHLGGLNGKTPADFGVSSMLACKSYELFGELASKGPTVITLEGYDKAKYEEYKKWEPTAKGYISKLEKLCKPDGTFTSTGETSGEIALWAFLHQAKNCGFITSFDPKLGKFFQRMEALPGIRRALDGSSKMGKLIDYLAAIPATVK